MLYREKEQNQIPKGKNVPRHGLEGGRDAYSSPRLAKGKLVACTSKSKFVYLCIFTV